MIVVVPVTVIFIVIVFSPDQSTQYIYDTLVQNIIFTFVSCIL